MSQQHIDLWKSTAQYFDQSYQAVSAEQWSADSPCDGWCVKDVVEHAVGTQAGMVGGLVGAEVAEGAEWPAVHSAISAALDQEGALDGTTQFGPMGEVPKTVAIGVAISDLLVHGWDIARATGGDEAMPAAPVEASYAGLQHFPEEMMRAEGRFAPAVECAADADTQTKLLCHTGRQP